MRKRLFVCLLAALVPGLSLVQAEDSGIPAGPCHRKQVAKPQRRKGGEAFPPLPLPATPLRRTEKKRPPAPPPLVAKIQYGDVLESVTPDGNVIPYYDWGKDPNDIAVLLNVAGSALNIRRTWKGSALRGLPTDPTQYPIFYYTGSNAFPLADVEAEKLREFIRNGGAIWADTCFGNPTFFKSFMEGAGKILPGRRFYKLPPDHPLFHCFYDIETVAYTRPVPDAPGGEPVFYGMDIGCRTAVILSRYDLSCGWDGHVREGAMAIHPNDARKLGVNMIVYALTTWPVARYQSVGKIYYEKERRARGDFVFQQARLTDNWDTQPNAIANLLKAVATKTSTEVKFHRRTVDLAKDDLHDYPFLYFTGHDEFELSEEEVLAVRRFLSAGGFLLATACCGKPAFDRAFRREMARILPNQQLEPLPASHPVYNILYDVQAVRYNSFLTSLGEEAPPLPLEGVTVGGVTSVVYCQYDLGGGWRGFDHPFSRGIAHDDALKLGVNIVLHSMTH